MKHFIYLRTHIEKIFLSIAHFARNVVYIFSEYHIKSCIDRIQIEYALIYNTHFQEILPFVRFTKIAKNLSKFEYNSHFQPVKEVLFLDYIQKENVSKIGTVLVSMKLILIENLVKCQLQSFVIKQKSKDCMLSRERINNKATCVSYVTCNSRIKNLR